MPTLDDYERQLAGYREAGDAPLPACPLVSAAFDPHPPHKVGIAHLLLKPRFGLFDPTGVGKTPMALVAWSYLHWQAGLKGIVLCRQKALYQWEAQVAKFLPGVKVEVLGDPKERPAQYARFLSGETPLLIGTRSVIIKDWTEPHATEVRQRQWQFDPAALGAFAIIFDEIHNIRGVQGGYIYPGARLLSLAARYAWGLTATPLFDKLEDVYATFDLLRPDMLGPYETFCTTYFHRYQMPVGKNKRFKIWKNGYAKKDAISYLMPQLAPFFIQRDLNAFAAYLPEVRTKTIVVEMAGAQKTLYDSIIASKFPQQEWAAAKGSSRSLAESHLKALKKEQKQQRLTGQSDPVELSKIAALLYAQLAVDAPEVLGINARSAKMDALIEFLTEEDPRSQAVVYTRFSQVATVLTRYLRAKKITTVLITGDQTAAKARTAQLAFQAGEARVCIITSAGGESIDLQAGNVVVFYDLPWAFGEFQQVLGRVRRVGSSHGSVLLLLLGITNTIDSKTLEILQRKEKLVAATFTLKDLLLQGEDFEETTVIHAPVPDTVLRSASITSDAFVHSLFDLMQGDASSAA